MRKYLLPFFLFVLIVLILPLKSFSQQDPVDSLTNAIKTLTADTNLVNAYIQLSDAERKKRLIEESLNHAGEAISLADKLKFQSGSIRGRIARANTQLAAADGNAAVATMNEAVELAKVNKDFIGLANSYNILAKIYGNTGNLDSIGIAGNLAIEAARKSGDQFAEAKALNFVGIAKMDQGEYPESIETLLKCLKLTEEIGDSMTRGSCLGNIANVYSYMQNNKEALKYFFISLDQKQHNKLYREVAISYSNIGRTYRRMEMLDSAKFYYLEAFAIADSLQDHYLLGVIANNLGDLYETVNKLDSALYYNRISFEINTLLKNQTSIILNLYQSGSLHMKMAGMKSDFSLYSKAMSEFDEGLNLAKEIGDKEKMVTGYRNLANVYEKLNKPAKSLEYLNLAYNLNDSIKNEQFTGQIAEMQTKYETEKKESEITKLNSEKMLDAEKIARQKTLNYSLVAIAVLLCITGFLVFRNVQRKRIAEKHIAILEKQNAVETMRSKIASDVHDDMGANLTRMGLNAQQLLQSGAVPVKEKQLAEKIALQSQEVITGMREIIWTSNPANDNLKSMLGFMRQYIDRFFDGTNIRPIVNFPHEVGEITLHPEVRRNLFLILKESLNNAVKYSSTDKIDIDFNSENENFNLNIRDYGKGLDDKNKDNFGNGLNNMQMRAQQIQSLFKLITAPGQGVHITIEGKLY